MNGIVDRLLALFATKGTRQYGGERVSQCEHALQCAFLAEREGVPETVVTAALLHDIGHLLHEAGEGLALRSIDDRHEELGAEYLLGVFGPAVAEPVRLHVAAKRYLCATDPGYLGCLSAASVRSLELQGGAFNPAEAATFRCRPFFEEAVRVRLWDDAAKSPGLATPPIEHYRATLLAASSG
jgi:[1-hydroxy-2-(trimethylamino)ethyl]phosphonate dioxygenase